jgi:hypothetical protein
MTGRSICIYGNSVILGTLGLNLRLCPGFAVTSLNPSPTDGQELEDLKPDVIFFDLEGSHPQAALSLLEIHPELLLIGVSPDNNLIKVWSGRQIQEISTQGLFEMINEHFKHSASV